MYVAVKGGEAAILNSYQLLARQRRGDAAQPELSVAQIRQQLKLATADHIVGLPRTTRAMRSAAALQEA